MFDEKNEMTLITHFRTKKHIVVASDGMSIRNYEKTYGNGRKIFTIKNNVLIANYGNVPHEIDNLLKSNTSLNYFLGRLDKIVSEKYPCFGLLVIDNKSSILYHKTSNIKKDINKIELEFNEFPKKPIKREFLLDELKDSAKDVVFFNEQLNDKGLIDYSHKNLLLNTFKDKFYEVLQTSDFCIESFNSINKIKETIIKFYDDVYSNKTKHKDIISGIIHLIIKIKNNDRIIFDETYPRKCCYQADYTNRDIINNVNDKIDPNFLFEYKEDFEKDNPL